MSVPAGPIVVAQAIAPVWRHWYRWRIHRGCRRKYDRAAFNRDLKAMIDRLTRKEIP